MPTAALSVAPMPEPVSRYHLPDPGLGFTPAACHRRFSFLWVPLSSPREANSARLPLIRFNAESSDKSPEDFLQDYYRLLNDLQHHFGDMKPTPIVSLSSYEVKKRYEQTRF